jgi:hypothetical protein
MDGKGFTLGKGIEGNRQGGRNAVHGVGGEEGSQSRELRKKRD